MLIGHPVPKTQAEIQLGLELQRPWLMAGKDNVHALMRDIGSQLALLEVTEFEELGTWTLVVDETTVLYAEYDEGRNVLVLSADVDKPTEARRLLLYDLVLQYNNLWRETG